jgi:phage terminase Nu1 subunit (DNA packaging protein)
MALPKTITTRELCEVTGYSAPAIVDLQKSGIIEKVAKDTWSIDAVSLIVSHLRDKIKRGVKSSAAEQELVAAKAQALKLRVAREAAELAPVQDFHDGIAAITDKIVAALVALPARFSRDIGERRRLETEINQIRSDVAASLTDEATRLEQAARKAARRQA